MKLKSIYLDRKKNLVRKIFKIFKSFVLKNLPTFRIEVYFQIEIDFLVCDNFVNKT